MMKKVVSAGLVAVVLGQASAAASAQEEVVTETLPSLLGADSNCDEVKALCIESCGGVEWTSQNECSVTEVGTSMTMCECVSSGTDTANMAALESLFNIPLFSQDAWFRTSDVDPIDRSVSYDATTQNDSTGQTRFYTTYQPLFISSFFDTADASYDSYGGSNDGEQGTVNSYFYSYGDTYQDEVPALFEATLQSSLCDFMRAVFADEKDTLMVTTYTDGEEYEMPSANIVPDEARYFMLANSPTYFGDRDLGDKKFEFFPEDDFESEPDWVLKSRWDNRDPGKPKGPPPPPPPPPGAVALSILLTVLTFSMAIAGCCMCAKGNAASRRARAASRLADVASASPLLDLEGEAAEVVFNPVANGKFDTDGEASVVYVTVATEEN